MLKNILTSAVAVLIVGVTTLIITTGRLNLFKNSTEEVLDNIDGTPGVVVNLSQIESLFNENKNIASNVLGEISFSNDKLLKYTNENEALLKKALKYPNDNDREILIGIIKDYDSVLEKTFGALDESSHQQLAYSIGLTNSHILTWAPYFYYLHSQSKAILSPTIKDLKEKNQELSEKLFGLDSSLSSKLAVQRFKLIFEDIARSGRRRNSDFVRFSYADYTQYKTFFDALAQKNLGFRLEFAKGGYILFDSFYNMHRDVDPTHNEEVRGWLNAARLELIKKHQESLLELGSKNKEEAKMVRDSIIKILNEQLELRKDEHIEVRTFIQRDLSSYIKVAL